MTGSKSGGTSASCRERQLIFNSGARAAHTSFDLSPSYAVSVCLSCDGMSAEYSAREYAVST